MTEEFEKIISKRLCPDVAKNETLYKVRNVYSNPHSRNSFSIEIRKCEENINKNCKPKELIDDFMSEVFFT